MYFLVAVVFENEEGIPIFPINTNDTLKLGIKQILSWF